MYIRMFKCECGTILETVDTNSFPKCSCGKVQTMANLKRCISRPSRKADKEFVNVCSAGDFKPYYSPDLGVYIDSHKKLRDTLKKRGMVCLTDSKDYREKEERMRAKALDMESTKQYRKEKHR